MKFDLTLYLVTDTNLHKLPFFEALIQALKGDVTLVQLREKNISTLAFLEKAHKTKTICDKFNVPLIINDRIDIALAVEAAGVHLGQDDMPLKYARTILGPDKIIGISANSIEEALEAEKNGADYIGASPIWSTQTKTDTEPPLGTDGLRKMCDTVKIPVVGIGGINASNASQVIKSGADGVAIVSYIFNADEPGRRAKEVCDAVLNRS